MRAGVLGLALAFFACTSAPRPPTLNAQTPEDESFRARIPSAGPRPRLEAPVPAVHRTSNGLTVVVVSDHSLPLVSMRLVFRRGAADDPEGREGLASVLAGLLTAGTETRDAAGIVAAQEQLATEIETSLEGESIALGATVARESFPAAFELTVDLVRASIYPDEALERARRERLEMLQGAQPQPARVAWRELMNLLYPGHPYSQAATGTAESIAALTRRDLHEWHARHLRPDAAALVVVGDVSLEDVVARVSATLGDWPPRETPERLLPPVEPTPPRMRLLHRADATQAELALGHPSVPRTHPDHLPLLIANAIYSARIDARMREQGLGSAAALLDARRAEGPWVISASVQADGAALAIDELISELERLRRDGISVEELNRARDALLLPLAFTFQDRGVVARSLATLFVFGLPFDHYRSLPERSTALTPEAVRSAVRRHLRPDALQGVVIGDRAVVEEQLRALDRGALEVREER